MDGEIRLSIQGIVGIRGKIVRDGDALLPQSGEEDAAKARLDRPRRAGLFA